MAGVVVVAVVLTVVLTNQSSKSPSSSTQALALQPVNDPGPAPFTPSTAKTSATASASATATGTGSSAPVTATATASGGTRSVDGSTTGLYGGTERLSSCDVAQLSAFLTAHPDKGKAWAGVEGIPQSDIPSYLHSLTPVVLRADTRVTNHGFSDGAATSFQAVLQSGTAVLVDSHGVPRARCACGNPLTPPVITSDRQSYTGTAWSSFHPANVVEVRPSVTIINIIVLYDPRTGTWFGRPVGSKGGSDHKVPPPTATPSASTSSSASASGSTSASPSTSASGSGSAPSSSASAPEATTGAPTTEPGSPPAATEAPATSALSAAIATPSPAAPSP